MYSFLPVGSDDWVPVGDLTGGELRWHLDGNVAVLLRRPQCEGQIVSVNLPRIFVYVQNNETAVLPGEPFQPPTSQSLRLVHRRTLLLPSAGSWRADVLYSATETRTIDLLGVLAAQNVISLPVALPSRACAAIRLGSDVGSFVDDDKAVTSGAWTTITLTLDSATPTNFVESAVNEYLVRRTGCIVSGAALLPSLVKGKRHVAGYSRVLLTCV